MPKALALVLLVAPVPAFAQNAYITNSGDGTVSVINTATNTVVGLPIPVGSRPVGVAVTSDGSKVYVTNSGGVSVIDTATNTVTATIPIGGELNGVAVTSDGGKVYVTTFEAAVINAVAVIDTATNTVSAMIPSEEGFPPNGIAVTPDGSKVYVTGPHGAVSVIDTTTNAVIGSTGSFRSSGIVASPDGSKVYYGADDLVGVIDTATDTVVDVIRGPFAFSFPRGIAVTPDGSKVYVSDFPDGGQVWVIDTATNTVVGSAIPVGSVPVGVSVTPDGGKVYVANSGDNTVSVIDTTTNMVVAVLPVGNAPMAFGLFIQPRFAGTPGDADCHGTSISSLAQTFSGLNAAAIALGFPTVQGLQTAVDAFCEG